MCCQPGNIGKNCQGPALQREKYCEGTIPPKRALIMETSGYHNCPSSECQGLIGPEMIRISRWRYQPKSHGILRRRRTILVYCDTCKTGFQMVKEDGNVGYVSWNFYRDQGSIARIKKQLPGYSDQLTRKIKDTYWPTSSKLEVVG